MKYLGLTFVAAAALALAGCAAGTGRTAVSSPNAPEAIGPYSQAVKAGGFLFLSGQIAIDPKTGRLAAAAGVEEQTRQVMDNLKAVLGADGLAFDDVVATTIYVKDLSDFAKVNDVYGSYFKSAPPARATVEVGRLPRDAKVEISAIAAH
jgi:2-iminobutanoate/2-iminopropanoate deaminase